MSPLIRMTRPEVSELWAYYEAGFHNLLVAGVNQRYPKEGMKSALGLLGEGQLSLTKCLILVDPQVNARDFHAMLLAIQQNFDPKEDVLILPGVPLDTLDFTSYTMNLGSKMVIDAVARLLPGTLGDAESAVQESFTSGLLDWPHYTRPESWDGRPVPPVLLGGNHAEIDRFIRAHGFALMQPVEQPTQPG